MKTLFIVRHGKSSWEYDDVKDIDRPLSERGIRDAYTMAVRLREKDLFPSRMISSPASRALHTGVIIKHVLGISDRDFFIDSNIYQANSRELMGILYGLDDHVASVMLIGHNPTFTDLANELSDHPLENLPTAGVVVIHFTVDKWTQVSRQNVSDHLIDYPKKS